MWRPERCTDRRSRSPARLRSAVRTRWRRRSKRESLAILLLLAFFAEDILAAVLDALALIGLRLAPLADLGGELTDALGVRARDNDRRRIGSRDAEIVRHRNVDVVAVAQLQAQILALHRGAIADA